MSVMFVPPGAWFGEPWPDRQYRAPICEDDALRVATPYGQPCAWCAIPIDIDDRGSFLHTGDGPRPLHNECGFRQTLGGIGHHIDCNHWCRIRNDPDGGRTKRESALEVWALYTEGNLRIQWPRKEGA